MILAPYNKWQAISPSDTVDLPTYQAPSVLLTAVYVGGTGDIEAVMQDGSVVKFAAVPVGTVLNIRPRRINNTNTTATNLVLLQAV